MGEDVHKWTPLLNGELVSCDGHWPRVYEFDTCYLADSKAIRPFGIISRFLFNRSAAIERLRKYSSACEDADVITAEWMERTNPHWPKEVRLAKNEPTHIGQAGMYIANLEYACDRCPSQASVELSAVDVAVFPGPIKAIPSDDDLVVDFDWGMGDRRIRSTPALDRAFAQDVNPFAYGTAFLLLLWACMGWEKWIGWVMR